MAERETEHRRIVVETPTARREVERTEAVRHPDRSGISGAALAAIVVGVIALATLIILFVMNQQQTANETAATQQQPATTIVQQPAAQQPPVVIEQQAPATQPVIVNNPAAGGSAPATGNGDAVVQAAVDKRLSEDATFSGLGITATVLDGKVTLTGIVQNQALKAQVERAIRNIKGVKVVDNQISVG
ncbi:MAG: BON domain-containing protein [Acidobacteriota bacterium]